MRRKCYKFLSLLILFFLVISCVQPASTGYALESPEENKRLHEEYLKKLEEAKDYQAALEKKKQEVEAEKKQLEIERDGLVAYVGELDEQMNVLSEELAELREKIAETEEELAKTQAELVIAKATEEDQYETMKARIRYMYENGEDSFADVLLTAKNITDVLNNAEYMYRITEYDNNLLDDYIIAKENVIEHENLLEATLQGLETMRVTAELEQSELDKLIEQKSEEIIKYTESIGVEDEILFNFADEIFEQGIAIEEIIATEEQRVAEWEKARKAEEERLRKEAEAAAAAAAAKAAAEKAAGQEVKLPASTSGYDATAIKDVVLKDEKSLSEMIWPLPGDHRTYSKFGPRVAPIKGASTYHKGWDIGGELGAPIVASLAGTVIAATSNYSGGNYVRIDHGNGVNTVYCHCSKLLVSAGEYVLQGQIIGLCGSTGISTAPHLHFAMTSNGTYIDPNPYIGHLE